LYASTVGKIVFFITVLFSMYPDKGGGSDIDTCLSVEDANIGCGTYSKTPAIWRKMREKR